MMVELRRATLQLLRTFHDRNYYQKAPKDAVFPYIVYDFPNSFMDKEQEIFNLDVDVWDNKDDTTELETIASNIWKGLNRYRYFDDNIQFSIYRENRLPPLDEDEKNIKRRKLIFQVRYFDRRFN
ncbi:MAG TPA: hypothetical protein VLA13_03575 [Massilibacterium sp.]|nr:hypothetical protein [Massilibacterium sp.]